MGDAARAHTSKEKQRMDAENVVGLIVALALLGYLVAALIRPEKF
ncbi:K(+)-transporting ATPase subunit F [Streptomyces sp. NPDC060334]